MRELCLTEISADRLENLELRAEVSEFLEQSVGSVAQQSLAWGDLVKPLGPDERYLLLCRDGKRIVGALPVFMFDGPCGRVANSCVQAGALGGIAVGPEVDRERVYESLLDGYVRLAQERRCALASWISNPFHRDLELGLRFFRPDYVLSNRCQYLDLDRSLTVEGRLVGASANVRRNLEKALNGSLRLDERQSLANVEEWYQIHARRHNEIGVEPLKMGLFIGALETMVRYDKARFFFVRLSGDSQEMVAGGFYVYHREVMDALMPSMNRTHAKLRPNYFLAWHSMCWAKTRGIRIYNWQASPPGSGVERFKAQWGSSVGPYSYLTRVTGDAKAIQNASPGTLQEGYPWHFVMPYDQLGYDRSKQTSPISTDRENAWKAVASEDG